MSNPAPRDSELRDLVRKYRVTWETRPEMGPSGHSVAPIGYVVELNAVGDEPKHASMIAPPETHDVEDALEKIVSAVADTEISHVARGTWQLGTSHDARPEVTATVTVLHHDGGGDNRPQDTKEQERLAALIERIRALGAQERHWRDDEGGKPT
jgi:hypothetical protein